MSISDLPEPVKGIDKTGLFSIILAIATFGVGTYLFPLRMMHADLSMIPGDLGDARLNNYFLEHGYRWLTGQVRSFWDAPFMFPAVRTISFSDNHLGTLPIYSLSRLLGADRESAYQLWFFVLFGLNYLSSFIVMRKLSVGRVGAAAGALIFTFSLPVVAQIGHSQLLARFSVPFAFLFAIRYFERRKLKDLARLCAAIVVQFYCSIYIGYFLILILIGLFAGYAIVEKGKGRMRDILWGDRRTMIRRVAIVGITLLALLPLMIPYLMTSLEYGTRCWGEIKMMLPRIQSYFYPARGSLFWGWIPASTELPVAHEHMIFAGAIPYLSLMVLAFLFRSRREDPDMRRAAIVAWSVIFIVCLTLYFGNSFYQLALIIPGIKAVRAVSRIMLVLLFPLSLIVGMIFTKYIETGIIARASFLKGALISVSFLAIIILDQGFRPVGYVVYDKTESQQRVKELADKIKNKGVNATLFVYMPDDPSLSGTVANIDAMMTAQDLGISTVNGYSGVFPGGYDYFFNYNKCETLHKWQEFSRIKFSKYYGRQDIFRGLIIVGNHRCIPEAVK